MNRRTRLRSTAHVVHRALVLLDLENALYPWPRLSDAALRDRFHTVLRHLPARASLILAGQADLIARLAGAIPANARVLPAPCLPDAADLKLLQAIDEGIPAGVHSVVLVSGDAIFAPAVSRLSREGYFVRVLARKMSLSADLYVAADDVQFLPTPVALPTSLQPVRCAVPRRFGRGAR